MHRLLGLFLLAAGIALGAAPAEAHPNVWIVAKSELMYAPDGSITFLIGNNTYVGSPAPQGSPVSDDVVDKAGGQAA